MRQNVKNLKHFILGATDGEIGKVKEFYFDDKTWTVRYMVIETGNWLSGRTVLISPKVFLNMDWKHRVFRVKLTKEQVKKSPDIDSKKTVSRQQEAKLNNHYGLDNYWEGSIWPGGIGTSGMMMPGYAPFEEEIEKANSGKSGISTGDPNLRSTERVTGYSIHAAEGTIGYVSDFIIDLDTWQLDFVIVNTGNRLHEKKVLVPTGRLTEIRWSTSEVFTDASVESVKNSPEYSPDRETDKIFQSSVSNFQS